MVLVKGSEKLISVTGSQKSISNKGSLKSTSKKGVTPISSQKGSSEQKTEAPVYKRATAITRHTPDEQPDLRKKYKPNIIRK